MNRRTYEAEIHAPDVDDPDPGWGAEVALAGSSSATWYDALSLPELVRTIVDDLAGRAGAVNLAWSVFDDDDPGAAQRLAEQSGAVLPVSTLHAVHIAPAPARHPSRRDRLRRG